MPQLASGYLDFPVQPDLLHPGVAIFLLSAFVVASRSICSG